MSEPAETQDTSETHEQQDNGQAAAMLKAQYDGMAARLRELGMPVDPNQVNIGSLRLMAQHLGLAHLLIEKGVATSEEIDLATVSSLHNLLGSLLAQVEQQQLEAARRAPKVATPPRGLYVPPSTLARKRTRQRHD